MTQPRSRVSALALWAAAIFAAGSWLVACGGASRAGGAEASGSGTVVEAARMSLRFTVPAVGTLEATKASPIAVPQVPTGSMKIKQVIPEGSIVQAGDVVLVFDDTQLNIELDNHKASFRSADRRIDRTQVQSTIESGSIDVMKEVAELERDNADAFQILDRDIFSKLEILEAQVKKTEAQETILFADASLLLRGQYYDIEERILDVERTEVRGKIGRVETSLGNLVLKAPIGGLIVYKKNWRGTTVAVGDTLWPGNVVLSIVDPSSTALNAFVVEKDAAGVVADAAATVEIDARPERAFTGRVKSVSEVSRPIERNSPVKYTEVRIVLEDGDPELLKPGMKGEARIVTGEVSDGVVVPRSALRGDAERPFVLVETADGPERREVALGPGDHVLVSIKEGLAGGERVLLAAGSDAGGDEGPPATPPATTPGG